MNKPAIKTAASDQAQRERALNSARSILVQAPAGSGKTDLLTRRFLRLLGEVADPGQIVAITFTKAAAAEMRHRILLELEKASNSVEFTELSDESSMEALAYRALRRSRALGWQLHSIAANLRVSTIDSFCRELATQQPLLSAFGAELRINEEPSALYRQAARSTLRKIGGENAVLSAAIQDLLLWRDNNWGELENLFVEMLGKRDRWMHDFVLEGEPDWNALRDRLERPFRNAVRQAIENVYRLLEQLPGARDEAVALARFACEQNGGALHQELAELADTRSLGDSGALDHARHALLCLANLVLTKEGSFRIRIDKNNGFPSEGEAEKSRLKRLITDLRTVEGFEAALCWVCFLPPPGYTEEDWHIVRTCFTLLRHATAELKVVFAEAGALDFIEVAQMAQKVLVGEDGLPNDATFAFADGIRHILVDEFQDTSRRQHRLIGSIAAAWPDQTGRTVFVVGDQAQSIYFFRDADPELFPRVQQFGLEIPDGDPLFFDFVPLTANFRTQPSLVQDLNDTFDRVFAQEDGSGVTFSAAEPAREQRGDSTPRFKLHFEFMPQTSSRDSSEADPSQLKRQIAARRNEAREKQIAEIVTLVRTHLDCVEQARSAGTKYRIAILGRTRRALEPIALALREAAIPVRAVDLEQLSERPEVLDALSLGRALFNPFDRIAWLGVLRAPWCGMALDELHTLTSGDRPDLLQPSVSHVIKERIHLLSADSRRNVERVLHAIESASALPEAVQMISLGTWLERVWLSLGGASCVNQTARANLRLLWRCLDELPNSAQDFLGPALDIALAGLTAMPDPAASAELGVQLMTIHKSKGLEFEVVILPELQARSTNTHGKLLSWLERGVATPNSPGEITEFLVAPIQSRGAERGLSKRWVDRMYLDRESQEMRRILYVAATRAREELHFFARPEYRNESGNSSLIEPANCLLATAWPALKERAQARFEEWYSAEKDSEAHEELWVENMAASAGGLEVVQHPVKPTMLRRLSASFAAPDLGRLPDAVQSGDQARPSKLDRYTHHEGGTASRALGTAVHRLLEESARLRTSRGRADARAPLGQMLPSIQAEIRSTGILQSEAKSIASRAFEIAYQATKDPLGQWILSPHAEAASEAAWTGIVGDELRSVRVDRVFRAGIEPMSEGKDAWWIIDFKTAHPDNLYPLLALPALRSLFAPQLEAYAVILRQLHREKLPIRAGLYYPRISMFDWWAVDA
jgi:ATP-dependent helicase/nuclease subunit A